MRFLVPVLLLALVLGTLASGQPTGAWAFSHRGAGSHLAAGVLDVELIALPGGGERVGSLLPGGCMATTYIIRNTGTLPAKFRVGIRESGSPPSPALGKAMTVSLCFLDPEGGEHLVDMGALADFTSAGNESSRVTGRRIFQAALIDNVALPGLQEDGSLSPGGELRLRLRIGLPLTAGSEVQGASFTGNLILEAVQPGGWGNDPRASSRGTGAVGT